MTSADIFMDGVALALGSTRFDFDCRLPEGKIIAVTGPSGSGKSTFLNLLTGFIKPERGRILIGSTDMTGFAPSERPVSVVFQDHNLFAHLDLLTNTGLGIHPNLKLSAMDRNHITKALSDVGLPGYEKRMPATLSGGERQRAAFARALVRQKPVLVLDEPFAALDPGLRHEMRCLLMELHQTTGNTVILVSHDPDEVRQLADYAVFLEAGRLAFHGPVSEFLQSGRLPALDRFLQG